MIDSEKEDSFMHCCKGNILHDFILDKILFSIAFFFRVYKYTALQKHMTYT